MVSYMSHQKDKQPKEKDKLYLMKVKNVFQGTSSRNRKTHIMGKISTNNTSHKKHMFQVYEEYIIKNSYSSAVKDR